MESVPRTTFAAEQILERNDIQRLLRQDISPIGSDLMVIAEEYGEWEKVNRRIDLLCLNQRGDLVVVEIKRTEDGGHMELQALRYAAMVSSMTLQQAIQTHARSSNQEEDEARGQILDFLESGTSTDIELTGEVRIILVSADFSTEVATAVLWLNKQGLDITCIRLRPYKMGNDVVIDVTQIIPLPEAADYEVKLRTQEREKRRAEGAVSETYRKFWSQLIERSQQSTNLLANRSPVANNWLEFPAGRTGFRWSLRLKPDACNVECLISIQKDRDKSMAAFQDLLARREEIEKGVGNPIEWDPYEKGIVKIVYKPLSKGWSHDESSWPELQDEMIEILVRFTAALGPAIESLKK